MLYDVTLLYLICSIILRVRIKGDDDANLFHGILPIQLQGGFLNIQVYILHVKISHL